MTKITLPNHSRVGPAVECHYGTFTNPEGIAWHGYHIFLDSLWVGVYSSARIAVLEAGSLRKNHSGEALLHLLEVCIREDDGSLVLGSEDVRYLERAYKGRRPI